MKTLLVYIGFTSYVAIELLINATHVLAQVGI